MAKRINAVEVNPAGQEPGGVIIWLHGLGADANDFTPIISELRIPDAYAIRYVFPNAPRRHITINGGMEMQGWFDIKSLDLSFQEDEEGIDLSVGQVFDIIAYERALGVQAKNIILAGFSQGGVIALHAALKFKERLGGVLALSTYLPLAAKLKETINKNNIGIPILMQHGLFDPVVPLNSAQKAKQVLESLGCKVVWNSYPMAHSLCGEEIDNISTWIKNRLSPVEQTVKVTEAAKVADINQAAVADNSVNSDAGVALVNSVSGGADNKSA